MNRAAKDAQRLAARIAERSVCHWQPKGFGYHAECLFSYSALHTYRNDAGNCTHCNRPVVIETAAERHVRIVGVRP